MKPVSPVIHGIAEVVYAKDQKEYLPLPAVKAKDGMITTRWFMSWRERFKLLLTGSLYLQVMTFNKPLQPVKLTVHKPTMKDVL